MQCSLRAKFYFGKAKFTSGNEFWEPVGGGGSGVESKNSVQLHPEPSNTLNPISWDFLARATVGTSLYVSLRQLVSQLTS